MIVGDVNSHSPSVRYVTIDLRGEEVEEWMTDNRLVFINEPQAEPAFYSRRWKSHNTPDLAIAT